MSERIERDVTIVDCGNTVHVTDEKLGSVVIHTLEAYMGTNGKFPVEIRPFTRTKPVFIGACPVNSDRPRDLIVFKSTQTTSELAGKYVNPQEEGAIHIDVMMRDDLVFNCELANTEHCPLQNQTVTNVNTA